MIVCALVTLRRRTFWRRRERSCWVRRPATASRDGTASSIGSGRCPRGPTRSQRRWDYGIVGACHRVWEKTPLLRSFSSYPPPHAVWEKGEVCHHKKIISKYSSVRFRVGVPSYARAQRYEFRVSSSWCPRSPQPTPPPSSTERFRPTVRSADVWLPCGRCPSTRSPLFVPRAPVRGLPRHPGVRRRRPSQRPAACPAPG